MSEGNIIVGLFVLIAALFAFLIWGAVRDANQLEERRIAFMASCIAERAEYDCQLQWDTYAAARDAERNAAMAAGLAAGAAANAAIKK